MKKVNKSSKQYIKHQHKIMVILGIAILFLSYSSDTSVWVIFGAIIIGAGLARINDD